MILCDISHFLIISCTGKNNIIGLRLNNNFFIQKLQTNIKEKDKLVSNIINFLKKNNANVDKNFSIIVNLGPGSFSSLRSSISIAKGLKISSGSSIYGFKDINLDFYTKIQHFP